MGVAVLLLDNTAAMNQEETFYIEVERQVLCHLVETFYESMEICCKDIEANDCLWKVTKVEEVVQVISSRRELFQMCLQRVIDIIMATQEPTQQTF